MEKVQKELGSIKLKERVMSSLKVKFDKEKAELDQQHAKDLAEIDAAATQKLMMGGVAGAALVVLLIAFFLMKGGSAVAEVNA